MNLTIGSGSASQLLSGKNTKGFASVLESFVSDYRPYWNALGSPINALRIGAILEQRYLDALGDEYYSQYKVTSEEFDCLTSSLDFAKLQGGEVVDFDELKTIFLTEYVDLIGPAASFPESERQQFIASRFKSNYIQIQFQLLCSGLESANLVFLSVESYDDDENYLREITEADFTKFRIMRDRDVINQIRDRAKFFQGIKDFINKK